MRHRDAPRWATPRLANVIANQQKPNPDRPWLDPTATPQIIINGVSKTYGGFTAVDNISLSIYKGEMFALVGASGCGKTTLLRMLAGFANQTAGQITIDGMEMAGVPPHERPVNMMFQSYALFPHMTVERNVGYGLKRMDLDSCGEEAAREGRARYGAARPSGPTQAAPALRRPTSACGAGSRADSPAEGAVCSTSRCRRSTRSCARRRSSS